MARRAAWGWIDFIQRIPLEFEQGRQYHHGELLLNLVEFSLVAVLGFMPLIVIHWADRRPTMRLPQKRWGSIAATRTAMLIGMTDWFMSIVL